MELVDKTSHLCDKRIMKNAKKESPAKVIAKIMKSMPSYDYRIFLHPLVAINALELVGDSTASRFVKEISKIIPRGWNGNMSHRIAVGAEYSRVIYLEIAKAYFPENFDEKALKDAISKISKKFKCDESDIKRDDSSALHWRFWWD